MPSRALCPTLVVSGLSVLLVAGCASHSRSPAPASFAPTKRDALSIAAVSYAAAETGKLRPNQVANTAPGEVLVDEHVDLALRKILWQVLQHADFASAGPARLLSAEITEFLADDLGFGVDWTLCIRYTVREPAGKTLYERAKVTRHSTTKIVNVAATVDDLLRRNTTDLVADDTFRRAVR